MIAIMIQVVVIVVVVVIIVKREGGGGGMGKASLGFIIYHLFFSIRITKSRPHPPDIPECTQHNPLPYIYVYVCTVCVCVSIFFNNNNK